MSKVMVRDMQSDGGIADNKETGLSIEFRVTALLNTNVEVNYYRDGGILHTVLRNLVK